MDQNRHDFIYNRILSFIISLFFIHEKRGKTATFSLLARAAAMHTQSSYSCFADSLQLARLYVYIFMCSSQKHKKWKIDALAYIKNWFDRSARVHNAVCAVQRRKRGEKKTTEHRTVSFLICFHFWACTEESESVRDKNADAQLCALFAHDAACSTCKIWAERLLWKKKENVDWLDSAIVFIAFIFHSFSSSLVAVHFISSLTRSRSIIITNSLYVKCIRVSIRSSAAFATAVAVLCSSSHRQFWIFDEFTQDDMVFYFCCYRINSVRRVSPLASAILKLIPEFESREHRKKIEIFCISLWVEHTLTLGIDLPFHHLYCCWFFRMISCAFHSLSRSSPPL